MSRSIAILGATGLVGSTVLRVLEERAFPVGALRLLAREGREPRTLPFRGRALPVEPVGPASFAGVELAIFACANAVSQRWADVARAAGARVVDNSSAFRYHDDVPLVVPEINGARLDAAPMRVANPNCSTIAIVMALAPLAAAAGLERVDVATYQSVSGAGRTALDDLELGVRAGLDRRPPPRRDGGPPFAFNVVPHIDRFLDNGFSREEMKIVWETRKILDRPDLAIAATAARVPVRVGHMAAVTALLGRPLEPAAARALWSTMPGMRVVDDPERGVYPMPLDAEGHDEVLVGRTRRDLDDPRRLLFMVASDNLRKGAATNAVQIAERLLGVTRPASVGGRP